MMGLGSWDADEGVGMAHHKLKLAKKGRYDFRKKNPTFDHRFDRRCGEGDW